MLELTVYRPSESTRADQHGPDGQHPDDGLLADLRSDRSDAAGRDGQFPGDFQKILPGQTLWTQTAVAADPRPLRPQSPFPRRRQRAAGVALPDFGPFALQRGRRIAFRGDQSRHQHRGRRVFFSSLLLFSSL